MLAGNISDESDFVLPGAARLVVIQVAGVIANFVDVGRDNGGESIILLQIDGQIGLGLPANFGESLGIAGTINGDSDNISASGMQLVDLLDRRRDVLRVRGRHALDGDWMSAADRDGSNANRSRRLALNGNGSRHAVSN